MATVWLVCFEFSGLVYQGVWGAVYQLESTNAFYAAMDLCAGALWILIALNANRIYPMLIAALQLLAMSAHLVRGLVDAIAPIAYAVMVVAPGWLQLFLLAIGLARHIGREGRYGPYREWRVAASWHRLIPTLWKRA